MMQRPLQIISAQFCALIATLEIGDMRYTPKDDAAVAAINAAFQDTSREKQDTREALQTIRDHTNELINSIDKAELPGAPDPRITGDSFAGTPAPTEAPTAPIVQHPIYKPEETQAQTPSTESTNV